MNKLNRKRHLDSIIGEEELEEVDDELEEDDGDWEEILEEEVRVKFSFLDAVKFGIGFGLGLFIIGTVLAFIGFTAFGGMMAGITNIIN